jgi:hypothetical protein
MVPKGGDGSRSKKGVTDKEWTWLSGRRCEVCQWVLNAVAFASHTLGSKEVRAGDWK